MAPQRFSWTPEARLAVYHLENDTDLQPQQKARVFSILFPETFINDGKMGNRIAAQTYEWKKPTGKLSKPWREVLKRSPSARLERESIRLRVRKAIAEAGFSIGTSVETTISGHDDHEHALPEPRPRASTPLSKKRPIARLSAQVRDELESGDELETDIVAPLLKRRKTVSTAGHDRPRARASHFLTSPQAVLARNRLSKSMTSKSKATKARAAVADPATTPKNVYQRGEGCDLELNPKEMNKVSQPLEPISEALAHPPLSGLLYRYWMKDDNEPQNSEAGFTARKYQGRWSFDQEPPHCGSLFWEDVFYHIDPSGKEHGYLSPFVSVSNSLWWILRQVLQNGKKKGTPQARISVIDAAALDKRAVYYAAPYMRELRVKRKPWTGKGHHYHGTHEHLCFKSIPRHAILHTFGLDDLIAMADGAPAIARFLRFDILLQTGNFKTDILPNKLRPAYIELDAETLRTMAKLVHFMGFDAIVEPERLSHVITDLIQGWGIRLTHASFNQWVQLAASFVQALADLDNRIVPSRDSMKLGWAVLDGVRYGASGTFNTRYHPEHIPRMEKKALEIGISDPVEMLSMAARLSAARINLNLYRYDLTKHAVDAVAKGGEHDTMEEIQVAGPSRRVATTSTLEALRDNFEEDLYGERMVYDEI